VSAIMNVNDNFRNGQLQLFGLATDDDDVRDVGLIFLGSGVDVLSGLG